MGDLTDVMDYINGIGNGDGNEKKGNGEVANKNKSLQAPPGNSTSTSGCPIKDFHNVPDPKTVTHPSAAGCVSEHKQFRIKMDENITNFIFSSFQEYMGQLKSSYTITKYFYLAIGVSGLALFIVSMISYFVYNNTSFYTQLGGALGFVETFYFVLFKPMEHLENGVSNQAQVMVVMLSWFCDRNNWVEYLEKLESQDELDTSHMGYVSSRLCRKTQKTMEMMEKYTEYRGTWDNFLSKVTEKGPGGANADPNKPKKTNEQLITPPIKVS